MAVSQISELRGHPESRHWRRFSVDIPLLIVTERDNVSLLGRGTELNGGGMKVFAMIDLCVGDEIAIEFTVPYSGHLVRIRASVRNRKGHSYGVEFITENDTDYKAIGQLEFLLGHMSRQQS